MTLEQAQEVQAAIICLDKFVSRLLRGKTGTHKAFVKRCEVASDSRDKAMTLISEEIDKIKREIHDITGDVEVPF